MAMSGRQAMAAGSAGVAAPAASRAALAGHPGRGGGQISVEDDGTQRAVG